MKLKFSLLFVIFYSFSLFALEHSIVPTLDQLESGKGLSIEKYNTRQWVDILSAIAKKKESLRVVSYNVLFTRYEKSLPDNYKWAERLPRLIHTILEMQPDLLGVQELLPVDRDSFTKSIPPKYSFFSGSKEAPFEGGILYNTLRFKVLSSEVYELSPKGTHGLESVMQMLLLEDQITEQKIAFFSTHLPFSDLEERESEAKRINAHIARFHKAHPEAFLILTGGFNTFPNRPDLQVLPFYDGDYVESLLKKDLFEDARHLAVIGHIGPLSTYTNTPNSPQPFQGHGVPGIFLDRIYVGSDISVLLHAINPATENDLWPSDHMPVIADIALPEKSKK